MNTAHDFLVQVGLPFDDDLVILLIYSGVRAELESNDLFTVFFAKSDACQPNHISWPDFSKRSFDLLSVCHWLGRKLHGIIQFPAEPGSNHVDRFQKSHMSRDHLILDLVPEFFLG